MEGGEGEGEATGAAKVRRCGGTEAYVCPVEEVALPYGCFVRDALENHSYAHTATERVEVAPPEVTCTGKPENRNQYARCASRLDGCVLERRS